MNKLMALSLPALMLLAGAAGADVYRCVSDDGTVRFSDQPCGGDAELFIEEEGCDIDQSIRRAYPFKDLNAEMEDINDRLVSHARKLGKCILSNETYRSYEVNEDRFRDMDHSWKISLNFGNREGRADWLLIFYYNQKPNEGDRRIRMTSIFVRLKGRRHNLPLLDNIFSLNRWATGKYGVQLQ